MEKKFAGRYVVFIAQRRILQKPTRKANKLKQKRPISRTLVAVHNAILDDLVYPAEIVGKRTRIRLDGSRLFKVHLDKNQQTNIEHKVSNSDVPWSYFFIVLMHLLELLHHLTPRVWECRKVCYRICHRQPP